MPPARVRFAPSPTGYLHIGGVRTALFNWLWARKTKGGFILRIEDTDQERSTRESVAVIFDSLRWLGLDWDEGPEVGGAHGPYTQMERLAVYREFAEKLIASGKAYRCYCTKEELDAQRAALKARDPKAQFRYPGTCRHRNDAPGLPFVVRFSVPETGSVRYVDQVFGEVVTPNAAQQDFVLLRSDGVPLYNFGAVVDDASMGVTLVARGRDHMVNTPPQIMIYEALGQPPPAFAHLPMMLAPNGEKLSKRHGAVSVTEYRDQGYSPRAVLNYLARFGWSHGDQEVFSLGEARRRVRLGALQQERRQVRREEVPCDQPLSTSRRRDSGAPGRTRRARRRSGPRGGSPSGPRASRPSSPSSASARPPSPTRPTGSTSSFATRPRSSRRLRRSSSSPRARRTFAAWPMRSRRSSPGPRPTSRRPSTRGSRAPGCR